MKQKTTTTLLTILGFLMLMVSTYLTLLHSTTDNPICNINSFFNCASALDSNLSTFAGVPIAWFGILTGALIAILTLFKRDWLPAFNLFIIFNTLGTIFLAAYSVIFLHTLCPFCSLYYLLSWLSAWLLLRNFTLEKFDLTKTIILGGGYVILFIGVLLFNLQSEQLSTQNNNDIDNDLYQQWLSYEKLPEPTLLSPFQLIPEKKPFAQHKVRILLFSDFECPACKMLVPAVDKLVETFKQSDVAFRYYPYPLDQACHPKIHRPFHQYACMAAKVAFCWHKDFLTLHDLLYNHQKDFHQNWLNDFITKEKLKPCINDKKIQERLVEFINFADQTYDVTSTPTLIINGVKIEGVYPTPLLIKLINQLLQH